MQLTNRSLAKKLHDHKVEVEKREEADNNIQRLDSKHVTHTHIYELRGQFISLRSSHTKMLEDYFFFFLTKNETTELFKELMVMLFTFPSTFKLPKDCN